jgi:hypothetical protein
MAHVFQPRQESQMVHSYDSYAAATVAEFNERLARSDGDSVARVLQENLLNDRVVWFDQQVLPLFARSPWPERAANESRCRHELSIYDAAEAASIAREAGYVPEGRANWFADWMLRLTVGTDANASTRVKLERYLRAQTGQRTDELGSELAAFLPEPTGARNLSLIVSPRRFFWEAARVSPTCFFVRTLASLLYFRTFVAVSTAFRDDSTAREASAMLESRNRPLMEALDEFVTGGGVTFLLAKDDAWLTGSSEPHGVLLPIFTLRATAERAACEGENVVCIDHREMLARFAELERLKVKYVAVVDNATTGEDHDARMLPVDRFLQVVKASVSQSNTGDLARAYRKAVTA